MLSKFLIVFLDYLYLYAFIFVDVKALPIYYLGFLYLVKVNALIFDYGKNQNLSLNLKALIPWSILFIILSLPLILLSGLGFWMWFNLWSLFMLSVGYGGYLILFKEFSIQHTLKFLWCRFGTDYNLNQVVGILLFVNLYMGFKTYILGYIPDFVLVAVFLSILFLISKTIRTKYF